jgi:predicted HTH transcriptional regulator
MSNSPGAGSEDLCALLVQLAALPEEVEWVEFKASFKDPEEIGQYLSALSNSAALKRKPKAYMVWGVEDQTHRLIGTTFRPRRTKKGNEDLESWLCRLLEPRLHFQIHEIQYIGLSFVLMEVPAAGHSPVRFKNVEYIRIGSYKHKLSDYVEKERELWSLFLQRPQFEHGIAMHSVTAAKVLELLDWQSYLGLIRGGALLESREMIDALVNERFIRRHGRAHYDITNIGALAIARDLDDFEDLARKAVRVIQYRGTNRVETLREQGGRKGYAAGFEGLMSYISGRLPENEHIGQALRAEVRIYPEMAVRELVANAIIHQDFERRGPGPRVEIFTDRIEITNPGVPLIEPSRFLDAQPQSRNDALAAFMHKAKICEERGSGIDKVFFEVEMYQLPAPDFTVNHDHTVSVLLSPRPLAQMGRTDRIRACYQHAGLQFVSYKRMTNASLRARLNIADRNHAIASRILGDTLEVGLIKPFDPENRSKRLAQYVPFWA